MGQIKIDVDDIYSNLLLIAISRKCNFSKLVKETEEETNDYIDGRNERILPEGYTGLYYTELLARKMGSSLGEACNLSEIRKGEIIQSILGNFKPISEADGGYYDEDEDGNIELNGILRILDVTNEKEIMLYYADGLNSEASNEHNLYAYYSVKLRKELESDGDETGILYSITIDGLQDFSSDYVYDSYELWTGKDGAFAESIEEIIKEYKVTYDDVDQTEDDIDEIEVDDDSVVVSSSTLEVEKPVIESEPIKEGPKIIDELVTYIWDDTRTVDLLDRFEGYGQSEPTRYRRIVIKNRKYIRYFNEHHPGFNLVIERGRGSDYVGNVTFTEFKKGEDSALAQYVADEVTDEIIEQYVDKDQFYRFSKPFLLRAQNSSNRTGYGWEWDWSGGYGDYTEGTLYGETTNYFFVGVYITTSYSYEVSSRKLFNNRKKLLTETLVNSESGMRIVFYDGKLNNITQNSVVQRFFKIEIPKGSKHIPVSYDETEDVYYIASVSAQKYKLIIKSGNFEVKKNYIE